MLWGPPAVIVVVLSVFLWHNTIDLDPYEPLPLPGEPLRVQAIGFDWKWLFVYPDLGIASVDELAFPADRQLAIELTSETVMQAFFIPSLGSQIYAMGGMVTRLHLAADGPGRFLGQNTQYNGTYFHRQQFQAVAMSDADFADWVKEARGSDALGGEAYAALERRNTASEAADALGLSLPLRFGNVSPRLFHEVVSEEPGQ